MQPVITYAKQQYISLTQTNTFCQHRQIHFADTDKYILPAQTNTIFQHTYISPAQTNTFCHHTNTFCQHRQIHFFSTHIHFAGTDKYFLPAQIDIFRRHRQINFSGTDKYSSTQTALSALITTMQLKLNFLSKDRIPTNIYTIVLLPWFQLRIRLYDPSVEQLH